MEKPEDVKKGNVVVIVNDLSTKQVVTGEKNELKAVKTNKYILGKPYTVQAVHLPFIVVDYPSSHHGKRYSTVIDTRDVELDLCDKDYEMAAGKA